MHGKCLGQAIVVACLVLWSCSHEAFAEQISANHLSLYNVTAENTVYKGLKSIKIQLTNQAQANFLSGATKGDEKTLALLPFALHNGVVEFDVAAELNDRGSKDARGFVGIAFRTASDASRFEAIYLRMTNGLLASPAPPEPRNQRGIQYFSYPEWPYYRFRETDPGKYEKPARVAPGQWFHCKIVVQGSKATAFIGNEKEPSLVVEDLKMGADAKGRVGLFVDEGTAAYFANIKTKRTK